MNRPDSEQKGPGSVPLAIVGIGCMFPKADGLGTYWANVKHGVDCIDEVPPTHWNPDDYFDPNPKTPDKTYARRGGFLKPVEFNPLEFGIAPRDLEATDTTQILGLVAAKKALDDAGVVFSDRKADSGVNKRPVDRNRVSVILGVTGTLELVIPLGARLGHPKWKRAMREAGIPEDRIEDAAARISDAYVPWQENSFPGLLGNVVAGRIANRLDLGGTNCVVDAACASSLSAVHLAALELANGRCDLAVTGGADTFNDIFMYMCFSKTPALSPNGDAKPFDANGDGTILGEGIGVVVLKRLADAERDGDRVYAVIRSVGSSSDGKGNAIYAPSAAGQRKALLSAYQLANVTPDSIELVEAHGTGTRVGDSVEATALTEVYGQAAGAKLKPWCALGSVKSQIGHTKAAAGAASLIKAALSLYNKVLPPTLKVNQPVEPLRSADSPFYVNTQMRPWLPRPDHPRRAALSAFGFGGSNFHSVLEEHRPQKPTPDWNGRMEILALSAGSVTELSNQLKKVPTDSWAAFSQAAETSRAGFRPKADLRIVLVAERNVTDLAALLLGAREKLRNHAGEAYWKTAEGAYFGSGSRSRLAVLFPGQGSQAVGMLRELACTFPEILDSLSLADRLVQLPDGNRLSDLIYPPTAFDKDIRSSQEDALRATEVAQPALGAVSFGLFQVLSNRFGIKVDCFGGHSYGELVALAAAQRLTPEDLFRISALRGQLMAEQAKRRDSGGMLAVFASAEQVAQLIQSQRVNVVVANQNSPNQTVVSGSLSELVLAEMALVGSKIKSVRLPVSAAFHSELVASASKPFRAELESIPFSEGVCPVFSNSTAAPYPDDPAQARDQLARQLAKPVLFVDQIRAMAQELGVKTFLEVGPGTVLARLVDSILPDQNDVRSLAVDSAVKSSGLKELAHVLGSLAASGQPLNLVAWEAGSLCRPEQGPKPAHTVSISGANVINPKPARPALPPLSMSHQPIRHTPVAGSPMSASAPQPNQPNSPVSSDLARETLLALQRLQEQTAQLHKQFLETQDQAQRTLHALITGGTVAAPTSTPVMPVPTPTMPIPAVRPPTPLIPPTPSAPQAGLAAPEAAEVSRAVPKPLPTPSTEIIDNIAPINRPAPTLEGNANADLERLLLEVVAEKTGYPVEMLELSMTLDGDLGIDSIKRVEILSSLQEKLPDAPPVKAEQLGTLQTLADVVTLLGSISPPATLPMRPAAKLSAVPDTAITDPQDAQSAGDVAKTLLEVVAEKTGYPVEMLELSMTLDGDLGIDSIKRVEILSSLQEKLPDAPPVKAEQLGTLQTLNDVVALLQHTVGGIANPDTEADAESADSDRKTDSIDPYPAMSANGTISEMPMPVPPEARVLKLPDGVERSVLQLLDLQPGGRPQLQWPAGTSVWLVGSEDELTQAIDRQLQARGLSPVRIPWQPPDPRHTAMEGTPAGLILVAPEAIPADWELCRWAFQWLQLAGPMLKRQGRERSGLFATVTRLDGAFGLAEISPDTDPISGGLAGLAKTVRHEWQEVQSKAIDVEPQFTKQNPQASATAIVDELLTIGPIEVGISESHHCCLGPPARLILPAHSELLSLPEPQQSVLITGGARGVTAEVTVALAHVCRATLILTGRSPEPATEEPTWASAATDEPSLKAAIAAHLGGDATPKVVSDWYGKLSAAREIRDTLRRVREAGGRAVYYSVDVTEPASLVSLVDQVQARHGTIAGLIHGAGILADKRIEELSPNQFDAVYRTKVVGLQNLLQAVPEKQLGFVLLFSSITARVGRTGQIAYACANEVLNKYAQVMARRSKARVVAINWGPWDGGMVTPSLKRLFHSEGTGVIPLESGGWFAVDELRCPGPAEVLALGTPPTNNRFASHDSGFHKARSEGEASVKTAPPEMHVSFERAIQVETHPVLNSHVLDGRAVLPMALHMEWLAHAALHDNPGLLFFGFDELRVTQGVMVEQAGTVNVKLLTGRVSKNNGIYYVPVELRGKRRDGREIVHSRGQVLLADALPNAGEPGPLPEVQPYPHPIGEVYNYFLFHGQDLQGIESVEGVGELGLVGSAFTAPLPTKWFTTPLRPGWVADPLVLDCSFQMMILWSFSQHGAGSLPCFVGRYRQYQKAFPAGPIQVVARVTRDNGSFARSDLDFLNADGKLIAQIQDYECVIDRQLDQAFRKNRFAPKVKQ